MVNNIKSLSEVMTVKKNYYHKGQAIGQETYDYQRKQQHWYGVESSCDTRYGHFVGTKNIVSRERQWRIRATILQSSGKMFAKNIFSILRSIKAREEGRLRGLMASMPMVTPRSMQLLPQPAVYNCYDQERFIRRKEETEGFNQYSINTTGTYYRIMLKSVTEGTNPAVRKPPTNPTSTMPSSLLPASVAKLTPQQIAQNKHPSITPRIIIVPSFNTSLITTYNAKDILQELKYISNKNKRAQGCKRKNEVLLQRREDRGLTVPYRVIDNPQKLTDADWERVVAVFVMGPTWQFKGWPFDGNPIKISKVCALHLKYDDMKLNAKVARWPVTVIELSRMKRHLDRATLMVFWKHLNNHMIIKNKPHFWF